MVDVEINKSSPLCVHFANDGKYDGLSIRTTVNTVHPIHMKDVMEIIYVEKGTVSLNIAFDRYTVNEGGFIVINPFELHSLESVTEGTVISCITAGGQFFNYREGLLVWWIDELKELEEYTTIAGLLTRIISMYKQNAEAEAVSDVMHEIVNRLRTAFKVEMYGNITQHGKTPTYRLTNDLQRLNKIYIYLYTHYDEKITLDSLCNELYLSRHYLSRYIHKTMGGTLSDSLGLIRSEKAEIKLLEGNKSLSAISAECGFSSGHYFNTVFQKVYGLTPAQYRKKYTEKTIRYLPFSGEVIGAEYISGKEAGNAKQIMIECPEDQYEITLIDENEPGRTPRVFTMGAGRNSINIELSKGNVILLIRSKQ